MTVVIRFHHRAGGTFDFKCVLSLRDAVLSKVTPTNPLMARLSCCIARCLLRFDTSQDRTRIASDRQEAVNILSECFGTYDRMYNEQKAIGLVVPSLVMDQADVLAYELGRLCRQIQEMASQRGATDFSTPVAAVGEWPCVSHVLSRGSLGCSDASMHADCFFRLTFVICCTQ